MKVACKNCGRPRGEVDFTGALCGACFAFKRRHGKPRPYRGDGRRKNSIVRKSGHKRARAAYKVMGTCEVCELAPAIDRHHKDDNTANNERSNVMFVCRRCHMLIDGRLSAMQEAARRGGNSAKTHCSRGHAYDEKNTFVTSTGRRHCRACDRENKARYRTLAKAIIVGETEDPRGNL